MTQPFSRRDLIGRAAPAVGLGVLAMAGADSLGQDKPTATLPESAVVKMLAQAQVGGVYALPKLPYEYNALEPHIDAQTMELHHSKHQQAYVTGLNKAIESLAKLRDDPEPNAATLSGLSRDISFNAGGLLLHTAFFGILGSAKQDRQPPTLSVQADIAKQYGSLDKFIAHFNKVAAGVKGSGWAIASYEPVANRILITESGDQDQRLIPGSTPFLLIDVWEHAYYLKHQNKRADYISAWWNVVNWAEVDALYQHIRARYRA